MNIASLFKKIPSSLLTLIAANVVAIVSAVTGRWQMIDVLFLYWFESAIIGISNIGKMLSAGVRRGEDFVPTLVIRILLSLFFIVHFGMFMIVHLKIISGLSKKYFGTPLDFGALWDAVSFNAWLLVLSHGYSFFKNYWFGGERWVAKPLNLMSQPYPRVVVMQLSLIIGSVIVIFMGQPVYLLITFIVVKMLIDAASHFQERRKFEKGAAPVEKTKP